MEDEMSTSHVCMFIIFEIFVIMAYDDRLLSVMSNQHTELDKYMILAQYNFLQQNQYFSVLPLTHCKFWSHLKHFIHV